MGKALESFGLQMGQAAGGGILGLMLGGLANKQQFNQAERLQGLQIKGQQQMADYNLQKQLELWNATNYKAQMEQLEKAGLNPGLIYGMSGGGGTTAAASPGQVTGQAAHKSDVMGIAMSAAQMGLLKAQKKNIEADTANKQAQTSAVPAQIEKTQTETKSINQGINNQQAQEVLTKLQARNQEIENEIKNYSKGTIEDILVLQASKLEKEISILTTQGMLDKQTANVKTDLLFAQLVKTGIETQAIKSNIEVNSAQIEKWANDIAQGWSSLDIKGKELKLQTIKTEIEQAKPGLWNVIGGTLQRYAQEVNRQLYGEKPYTVEEAMKH